MQSDLLSLVIRRQHTVEGYDCHIFAGILRGHGVLISGVGDEAVFLYPPKVDPVDDVLSGEGAQPLLFQPLKRNLVRGGMNFAIDLITPSHLFPFTSATKLHFFLGVFLHFITGADTENCCASLRPASSGTPRCFGFPHQCQRIVDSRFSPPLCWDFRSAGFEFGCELDYSRARGIDVRMIPTDAPYMDATSGQGAMMAVSATSKNPERALMFLNLLNTDPELMTMLNYGTEGYTYNKNADGTISFIDEVRATYSPWTNGMGNVRQLPPTAEQGVDFWDRFSAYYDSAEVLPCGSFVLDTSELPNEATALANVYGQYGFQLMGGATNPDTVLPEFLAKLEEAGIQKLLDTANEQLAVYLAG